VYAYVPEIIRFYLKEELAIGRSAPQGSRRRDHYHH
jgi:uncharacterized circularly permuted ATP-grasp superfamily protein